MMRWPFPPVDAKTKFISTVSAIKEGLNFTQKGQLKKRLSLFTAAIELDPCRWEAYRYRGQTYAKLGKYNLALKNYDIIIQHAPPSADFLFERGLIKLLSGQSESALKDFSNCILINPNYASAYSSRAEIFTRNGLYTKALEEINILNFLYQ